MKSDRSEGHGTSGNPIKRCKNGRRGGVAEGGLAQDRSDKGLNDYCTARTQQRKTTSGRGGLASNGQTRSEQGSVPTLWLRGTDAAVSIKMYGRAPK